MKTRKKIMCSLGVVMGAGLICYALIPREKKEELKGKFMDMMDADKSFLDEMSF